MKRPWSWLLMSFALAIGLASIFDISQYRTHELMALGIQGGRTWTVCAQGCDFATIQQAIEAAQPKDEIKIQSGVYTENLVVRKDLTLLGAGPKQTIVQASNPDKPILYVPGETEVNILIYNIAFVDPFRSTSASFCSGLALYGQCPVGIEVGGKAHLHLERIRVEDSRGGAIWGHNTAIVKVSHSEIRDPDWYGLLLEDAAQFKVIGSHIAVPNSGGPPASAFDPEKYGVLAREEARLDMGASSISSHYRYIAIKLEDQAQADLSLMYIAENLQGIELRDETKATITESVITKQSLAAIRAQDRAQFVIKFSYLAINTPGSVHGAIRLQDEARAYIYKTDFITNGAGIFVADSAQVTLNYSRLLRNNRGVALHVSPCYIPAPEQARVTILGQGNEIPDKKDNPEDGNVEALCPADYPWPPGFRK